MNWDFGQRPLLVFWETTKACKLTCRHCRADAIEKSLPGELSTQEAKALIDEIWSFGKPYPIIIFTGGDALMRKDLGVVMRYAAERGMTFAVSPSATPLLTESAIAGIKKSGAFGISISLDGMMGTHEAIRGVEGTWERSIEAIKSAVSLGLKVQINTCVMKSNVGELPELFSAVKTLGAQIWEVFFLMNVGRGNSVEPLGPEECEDVCNFLYDASFYGVVVRTVEAPFFRRVVSERSAGKPAPETALYTRMANGLSRACGQPSSPLTAHTKGTGDGKGIVFVSHDGGIYPGGFLPVSRGNVKKDSLRDIYAKDELFIKLRDAKSFSGKCGKCEYNSVCGGSRARAFAETGNPLAEDTSCIFQPAL